MTTDSREAAEVIERLGIQKTPDPQVQRSHTPTTRGKETGMGICAFWSTLFLANEGLPKRRRMTDAEIKRQVLEEFPADSQPNRTKESLRKLAEGEVTVNYYRGLYNKGRLTNGKVPEKSSKRYGDNGDEVRGKSGKPL